jgi:hypothetical protein
MASEIGGQCLRLNPLAKHDAKPSHFCPGVCTKLRKISFCGKRF